MNPVRVGIIGCGNISSTYLLTCRRFASLAVVAVADLDAARAQQKAAEFGVLAMTPEALLSDPGIELIVNLTVPTVHAEVSRSALAAGKHVYSEKPLATTREDGQALLVLAQEQGLRLGCAPDTFMGGGLQTCRKLVDDGWIGTPIAATAFMMSRGPESWHPNPFFFYQEGGGPLLDMAPYYLTALVNLLGPVRRVTGMAKQSFATRRATSTALYGTTIPVAVPTHVVGVLEHEGGAVSTLITSFDIAASELPRIEVYGSEGTLSTPDPNTFGGPVRLRRLGAESWSEVPLSHGYTTGNWRGLATADLAQALRSGRPHRASAELAFHVLDTMLAILEAAHNGQAQTLASTTCRPAPLPLGLLEGELDD
jgi:predicted dehydrogenase